METVGFTVWIPRSAFDDLEPAEKAEARRSGEKPTGRSGERKEGEELTPAHAPMRACARERPREAASRQELPGGPVTPTAHGKRRKTDRAGKPHPHPTPGDGANITHHLYCLKWATPPVGEESPAGGKEHSFSC
uniref:Uncharacterized protein n=1 Tax=Mustela putorius furo TaxID=9669 RepID=M3Y0U8_MUSPF